MNQLFTIGHSNRPMEEFLLLLREFGVQAVADVRSYPRSRYNPQFDRQSISSSLKSAGISYVFLGAELGARRSEKECYINGTVDYDLVARSDSFAKGLDRVCAGLAKMSIALMCAEKDPLTCHRTILVSKELKGRVTDIRHILGRDKVECHAEAELRLLSEYRTDGGDLFVSNEELLKNAYRKRGREIAYTEDSAS